MSETNQCDVLRLLVLNGQVIPIFFCEGALQHAVPGALNLACIPFGAVIVIIRVRILFLNGVSFHVVVISTRERSRMDHPMSGGDGSQKRSAVCSSVYFIEEDQSLGLRLRVFTS